MENNKEILHKINSNDPELLAEAVKEIQEKGDLSMADALLDILENTKDFQLINALSSLLSDIKDSRFREILLKKLKAATQASQKSLLLRIVWESSLNYAPDLEVFLTYLQDSDFTVAFEASTVIENMLPNLSHEQLQQLEHVCSNFPADKKILVENILSLLEEENENFS